MYVGRNFRTGQFKECGSIVDILHHCHRFALHSARQTYYKRSTERLLVHPTFVEPAMFAHIEPLVRCIYDKSIICKAFFFEIVEYTAHIAVNRCYHAQVVAHILLVFPCIQILTFETCCLELGNNLVVMCIPSLLLLRVHIAVHTTAPGFEVGTTMYCTVLIGHFEVVNKVHILAY